MVQVCAVPEDGLLQAYVGQGANYTDCFATAVPGDVTLSQFIEAFYTTWLFRMERAVLSLPLRRRVKDSEVAALARGADRFAVWAVEARAETQILLRERSGHTRSFFAVVASETGETRLMFGSAVVARQGQPLGRMIRLLTPLHRLYSKALLHLAARNLRFT